MALEEISKRFTLHDLFGYLFSGILTLVGCGAYVVAFGIQSDSEQAKSIVAAFLSLHVVSQGTVSLTFAYFIGLICVTIGDFLCHITFRRFGFSGKDLLFKGEPSERGWALSEQIKEELKDGVHKVMNCKKNFNDQEKLSVAYSYLMNRSKDGFTQLMSGRQVTFTSLAGASFLTGVFGLCVMYKSGIAVSGWSEIALPHLVGTALALRKAQSFDCWWTKTVVYDFLVAQQCSQNANQSSQANSSS